MDKENLLRLVDSLHRDKEIAKEVVFQGIEAALITAAKKHFRSQEAVSIQIDRKTGEIIICDGFSFSILSRLILSFLKTSIFSPNAPICCTRL